MSTRGHVAIKENGKYRYIYNHHDSYIDGLGITLFQYYKDGGEKVRALINLGDTGSIGVSIENDAESYEEHLNRPLDKRGTVSIIRESKRWKYFRDADTEDCVPFETEDIDEVLGQDYTYIFDVEENKWYMAYWNDKYRLRDLEEVLHSKELLEKLFSGVYVKDYLPEFYEKCLNA